MNVSRETSDRTLLKQYREMVLQANRRLALVSRKNPEAALDRLIEHALSATALIPETIERVVDVGSGSGLPGIPMAILRPDLHVQTIDRSRNKVLFMQQAVLRLGIENVEPRQAVFQPRMLVGESPVLLTAVGLGGYDQLVPGAWRIMRPGDAVLLFVSKRTAATLSAAVSRETFDWMPLKDSDTTGVFLLTYPS